MELLILALTFVGVASLIFGIASYSTRAPAARRLSRISDTSVLALESARDRGVIQSDFSDKWGGLARFMSRFAPGGKAQQASGSLRTRLIQAGFRRRSAPLVYQGSRVVLAVAMAALVLTLPFSYRLDEQKLAIVLFLVAGFGFILPGYIVDMFRNYRQNQVSSGLPDALDLMVVCVEAGLGVNASLSRVAVEMERTNPVLSSEFELVTLETVAGKSTMDALRSLADRTGVSDVSSMVAMLIQTERFGTQLADTLRVHADAIRRARLLAAEELAQRAPLKMLFPTALLIFPATVIVTVGPGIMQLLAALRGD